MKVIKASTITDSQLLKGLQDSDRKAIQAIYDLALPAVIDWVKQNNGNEQDARDIFQEALIALFRKVSEGEFTLTCTLKSFIRIMCRNLWLTRLRDGKKMQASPLEDVEPIQLPDDLITRLERSAKDQLFYKHFDALGENCQKILTWFFDKVKLAEIARRLDTSEGYIKKRKFVCKEKLIKAIQADPNFKDLE